MEADGQCQVEKPYYDDLSHLLRPFNVVLLRVTQGNLWVPFSQLIPPPATCHTSSQPSILSQFYLCPEL